MIRIAALAVALVVGAAVVEVVMSWWAFRVTANPKRLTPAHRQALDGGTG